MTSRGDSQSAVPLPADLSEVDAPWVDAFLRQAQIVHTERVVAIELAEAMGGLAVTGVVRRVHVRYDGLAVDADGVAASLRAR